MFLRNIKNKLLLTGCIMILSLSAFGCSETKDNTSNESTSQATSEITTNAVAQPSTEISVAPTTANTEAATTVTEAPTQGTTAAQQPVNSGSVSASFKKTMDDFEAKANEYYTFMKKYKDAESIDQLNMLEQYMETKQKFSDALTDIAKITSDGLSQADLAYYMEIHSRVIKKVVEVY